MLRVGLVSIEITYEMLEFSNETKPKPPVVATSELFTVRNLGAYQQNPINGLVLLQNPL
jgi:hypothetical protein